ncbi:MAG: T9SS type A sorting domain-containing protein [Sphingobacteriales bacterium]|nr:T9SS type A sorting domain-containing protein [Sphingobacteriales bacterium]
MKTITILISWLLGFMLSAQTASNLSVLITPASKCEQQGCIDITINGGHSPYMVEWWGNTVSNSEIVVNGSSDLADLCNIPAGNYWLYITDAWCGAIFTVFTVPEQNASIEVLSLQHVSKCEGNICDGAISVAIDEDLVGKDYELEWSKEGGGSVGGSYTETGIMNLCQGTYIVELYTENYECLIDTKKIEVCCCKGDVTPSITYPNCDGYTQVYPLLEITGATPIVPTLDNPTGGSINIDVSIPDDYTTPVVYQWTGPNGYTASTQDISGLGPGKYCVVITTGCSYKIKKCYELFSCDFIKLEVTAVGTSGDCNGLGTASASASGGKSPYNFIWSNGLQGSTINYLSSGTYTVQAIDANGCKSTNIGSVEIKNNEGLLTADEKCGIYCNGKFIEQGEITEQQTDPNCIVTTYCTGNLAHVGNAGEYELKMTNFTSCDAAKICKNDPNPENPHFFGIDGIPLGGITLFSKDIDKQCFRCAQVDAYCEFIDVEPLNPNGPINVRFITDLVVNLEIKFDTIGICGTSASMILATCDGKQITFCDDEFCACKCNYYEGAFFEDSGKKSINENTDTSLHKNSNFVVSPNPFKDYLNIIMELSQKEHLNITLYNSIGEMVFLMKKEVEQGRGVLQADFSKMVSGVYFLHINNALNTTIFQQKLIKIE